MKKLFRRSLLLPVFIFASLLPAKATHIVGGDITVKSLGSNNFEITLTLLFDCINGSAGAFDPTATVGIFDKVTNVQQLQVVIPFIDSVNLQLGDTCYTPTTLCVRKQRYIDTVSIPNNPAGYYLSWLRCCRNGFIITNIANPAASGNVFYVEIPDPALMNSTPTFSLYPDAYMCVGLPNSDNFSATDIDGDSLVYSLVSPMDCSANGQCSNTTPNPGAAPGPYGVVTWLPPYTAINMMGDPAQSISQTGILSTTPPALGVFVICVKVEEYNKTTKVKLGEIRRDVQYAVFSCPLPSVNITGPNPLCLGQTTTLTALGGTSYSWNTGAITSSIIVTPTAAGTYTFSVLNIVNSTCRLYADTAITVNPAATASAVAFPTTICVGQSSNLSVVGTGTYQWSPAGSLNNPTSANPIASPSITTNYIVTVTNSFGCTATDVVTITVVVGTLPNPQITGDTVLCLGESTVLTGSGGITYSWLPGGSTANSIVVTPLFSNTYTLIAITTCTFASTTIPVTVANIPFVAAIASTTICPGDSAMLNANANNGTAPYLWSWNPPTMLNNASLQNPLASPNNTTTYTVTVTDANGCTDDTSTTIFVGTEPTAAIAPWTPELTCDGYIVPFRLNGSSNATSWYWDFGDGTNSTMQNPVHAYPFNASYVVTLIVFNPPCRDSIDTTLIVSDLSRFINISCANVFTPNNDNMNDCFHPVFTVQNIPNPTSTDSLVDVLSQCSYIEVYDRWGIKMFQTTDTEKCWDGKTLKGKDANEGTYYYIAKFGELTLRCYVTLLREK